VIEVNVLTDPNQAVDISENTKDVKVGRGALWLYVPLLCLVLDHGIMTRGVFGPPHPNQAVDISENTKDVKVGRGAL
jgi:hypothetical protein